MIGIASRLYCAIYQHFLETENNSNYSADMYFAWSALIGICLIEWFVVLIFFLLVGLFAPNLYSVPTGVTIMACIVYVNWYMFVRNDRYDALLQEYLSSDTKEKLRAKRTFYACLIGICIGVAVAILARWNF